MERERRNGEYSCREAVVAELHVHMFNRRQCMSEFLKLKARLEEVYSTYETITEVDNGTEYFVIINPFWNENIRISHEDGITFFFSFVHQHFDYSDDFDDNMEDLIDKIGMFL